MYDAILKWCANANPIIFSFIVVITITVYVTKLYHRFISVEKKTDKIDDYIIPKLDELIFAVKSILMYLKSKDPELDITFFLGKSPLQLTPLAERALMECGGKNLVDQNLGQLTAYIYKQKPKSPFDVETEATIAILNLSESDAFTPVKDFIYENPYYRVEGENEVRITLPKIIDVITIYLRNQYLLAHPMPVKKLSGS